MQSIWLHKHSGCLENLIAPRSFYRPVNDCSNENSPSRLSYHFTAFYLFFVGGKGNWWWAANMVKWWYWWCLKHIYKYSPIVIYEHNTKPYFWARIQTGSSRADVDLFVGRKSRRGFLCVCLCGVDSERVPGNTSSAVTTSIPTTTHATDTNTDTDTGINTIKCKLKPY